MNLGLSIQVIDSGLRVIAETTYGLTSLRLGALMREAGYVALGVDPARHYAGVMPWHGSLPEVEKRLSDFAKRRATVEATLEDALLDDDVRAQRDAEAAALSAAINGLLISGTVETAGNWSPTGTARRS